jgi:ribosomal protein L32E
MDMTPGRFEAILEENANDRENIDEIDFALAIFAQVGSYDKLKVIKRIKEFKILYNSIL